MDVSFCKEESLGVASGIVNNDQDELVPLVDFGRGHMRSIPTLSNRTSMTGREMKGARAGFCGAVHWH